MTLRLKLCHYYSTQFNDRVYESNSQSNSQIKFVFTKKTKISYIQKILDVNILIVVYTE